MSSVGYYRMFDAEPKGVFEIEPRDARGWNQKGFGIFWTVNSFSGPRRTENLTRINAWAVDMDLGTKSDMRAKINSSPVVPSLVVETKRGYQVYFRASNGTPERWNDIVLNRLVPYFGADKNARDLARILRVPGFNHLKDPKEPFLVTTVWSYPSEYTEEQVMRVFPLAVEEQNARDVHAAVRREIKFNGSDEFWDRVWALDCEEALRRLGPALGESYTFRQNQNGKKNIYVNGKGTSCFIDQNGRIGSLDKGGPTAYNWIVWFGYSPKQAVEMLKRSFPELEQK